MTTTSAHGQIGLGDIPDLAAILLSLEGVRSGPWKPLNGLVVTEFVGVKPDAATRLSQALTESGKIPYRGKFAMLRIRGQTRQALPQKGLSRHILPFFGSGKVNGEDLLIGGLTALGGDAILEVPSATELYCLLFWEIQPDPPPPIHSSN